MEHLNNLSQFVNAGVGMVDFHTPSIHTSCRFAKKQPAPLQLYWRDGISESRKTLGRFPPSWKAFGKLAECFSAEDLEGNFP